MYNYVTICKEMNSNQLLTRTELALKLNVSEKHIYNLQQKGLPTIWVGILPRFEYMQVIKWLNQYYKKQDLERGGEK